MGIRVLVLGFGVWGLGFQVSVFGLRVHGSGLGVQRIEFRVSEFRISGFGFRIKEVSGFWLWVEGFKFQV